ANDLAERAAVHVLADLERHAGRVLGAEVAEVVDAKRVGVREARERECFLDEVLVARAPDPGLAAEPAEHLDADRARQALVGAAEPHRVAARADLLDHAITLEHDVTDLDIGRLGRRCGRWRLRRTRHRRKILTYIGVYVLPAPASLAFAPAAS